MGDTETAASFMPFGKVGFALNVKTQRVLFSILAVILVAGMLFAIYFTSQPSNANGGETSDNSQVSGEASDGGEVSDGNKGPLVDFDHESASLGDKLIFGLQTAGIGMAIVFAVLIILWGAIALVSKIVGGESAPKAAPAKQTPVSAAPAQAQTADTTDESELVAVCTAAIAASRGESDCAFNVISITEIK